jgi:hypothetical protein
MKNPDATLVDTAATTGSEVVGRANPVDLHPTSTSVGDA